MIIMSSKPLFTASTSTSPSLHHNQTQTLHFPIPNPHSPNSQLSPPNSLPSRPLLSNPSHSWPPPRSANPHHHGRVLLILQFSLDKLYFTPLGNFMDEKDTAIREKLDEGGKKLKVEAELQEALISLEQQKEETIKVLDSQIAAHCQDIVKKVLPTA